MHFGTTSESEFFTTPKFIPEHPLIAMQNGCIANKIPVLRNTGITEGLFFAALRKLP